MAPAFHSWELHRDKKTSEYVLIAVMRDFDNMSDGLLEFMRFKSGDECFRFLSHYFGNGIRVNLIANLVTDSYGVYDSYEIMARESFENYKFHWTKIRSPWRRYNNRNLMKLQKELETRNRMAAIACISLVVLLFQEN